MNLTIGKVWRAMHPRGREHEVPSEQSEPLSGKKSRRANFIKKFIGRGKKGRQGSKNDSNFPDEREHPAVSSGESANTPTIGSEVPIMGHVDETIGNPQYLGHTDIVPEQDQLLVDGTIDRNVAYLTQEVTLGGDISGPLAETENPVPSSWARPTIRRVVSEYHLPHTRDVASSNSGGRLLCSESFILPNAIENHTAPSKDSQAGSGSLRSSNRTSKSSHEHWPPFGQASPDSPKSTKLQAEDDNSDGASTKSSHERVWKLVLKSRKQSYKYELEDVKNAHADELKALELHHRGEIMAVEAERAALQRTVQELESWRATTEANLEQTDRSAPDDQTPATLVSVDDLKAVQEERDSALTSKRNLARELNTAQNQGVYLQRRVIELSKALEKSPNDVANISGVAELKDRMFSDLEMRAGECFTALTALEETSAEQKEISSREMANLNAKLEEKENTLTEFLTSKNNFRRKSEEVFEMLLSKVYRDDLINAMEEYFQITIQDNSFLQTVVERQNGEISGRDLEIKALETAAGEARRSLEAKTKASDEAGLALATKDVELGALRMELDSLKADHQSVIEQKDGQLENAHWRLQKAYDETVELMGKTRNEREKWIIKTKDDQFAALQQKCQELHLARQQTEERLHAQVQMSERNASAANEEEAKSADALFELKEAQDQIESLQKELRGRLGLPASINVLEVLAMKQELDEARLRLQG